jgi:glycosyltransferase involved in cell wall biosynthesis
MKKTKETKKRIMIIGAISYPNRNSSLGGCTVLMENFLNYCQKNKIDFIHISTNRWEGHLAFLRNFLYLFCRFLIALPRVQIVMINASYNGAFRVFPILAPICKLSGRKIVFRMFAGSYRQLYEKEPVWSRFIARRALKMADLVMGETQKVTAFFRELLGAEKKIIWFPNVRTGETEIFQRPYRKKFVFISRILESKGVDLILKVMKTLPADYSCDFYGPIVEKKYNADYFSSSQTAYKGVLAPSQVRETLLDYDVLLLPTYCTGEGYPGIIIEAMEQGMPAISTWFGGIPEIINDGSNGILIPTQDPAALKDAMQTITPESYQNLSCNARQAFLETFDANTVNTRIHKEIMKTITAEK